ncbi:tail fiber protein [Flavobacterium sp. LT1R49]|uniref:tail fiber protein n=1 Tax=Flavobacterium arabinosi TaxID=3398737 RepID=UPI003A862BE6
MKTKLLLLSLLMLLTVTTNYAQTSASVAGIAIQGIARDNNNTARVSATLNLTFRIYYGANIAIYEVTKTVTSDAFGVFSVVLEPGAANNILIANNQAFLKISEGTTIISDESLKQVPYAIAASNGVPTGSIMPFIGTSVPEGWALCNGDPLPSTATALIGMIGSKAPNLRGRFLRGAGDDAQPNTDTVDLKTYQDQQFKSHNHNVTDPGHTHVYNDIYHSENGGEITIGAKDAWRGSGDTDYDNSGWGIDRTTNNSPTGITINANGGEETRPVNYGVNYIIKL